MLLFRPPLMHFGRAGVLPGGFATAGNAPSPLANDLPDLADRPQSEWLWTLLTPLPASGTTAVDDSGGYELVGPADGAWEQFYRILVMPLTGSAIVADGAGYKITTTVATAVDTEPPVMQGGISISALTSSSYTSGVAAATDNVAVTAYQVSQNSGVSWIDKALVRTHNHTGRTPSTTDVVMWRARDAAGNWATPLVVSVDLPAGSVATPPTMNGSLSISSVTATDYHVSWAAASDAVGVTGYERSLDGGDTWADLGNALNMTVAGRTPGSTDAVRVRAYNAAGLRASAPLATSVTLLSGVVVRLPISGNDYFDLIQRIAVTQA